MNGQVEILPQKFENSILSVTLKGDDDEYIGKTVRCLVTRLHEHTKPDKSAVGEHFKRINMNLLNT